MEALPLISILVIVFSLLLISEIIKLKKEIRKNSRLTRIMQKDINKLKAKIDDK